LTLLFSRLGREDSSLGGILFVGGYDVAVFWELFDALALVSLGGYFVCEQRLFVFRRERV
jgi:hypothetical protein